MLSKEVPSTILKIFGMMRPGIEPRSPGPLVNTLPTRLMSQYIYIYIYIHGAFNKFPDFLYRHLNCRRLLKIHYVIAIHLMR